MKHFLSVALFIVELRFKKYNFCWFTCCALNYLKFFSLIPIQLAPEIFLLPFTAIVLQLLDCIFPVLFDDCVLSSPICNEIETDQILNAKWFVWKKVILGKWGLRKAFSRNSLKQHFNGDRQPSVNNFIPRHIDSI